MSAIKPGSRLQIMLDHTEKQAIEWAFKQVKKTNHVAELLGISRPYLYRRIRALELEHLLPKNAKKKKAKAAP